MSFTFIHTADWQIGKAFAGFPADVAAALREARLSAIDRIAEAAERAGARHVLVAGDVFDADTLAPKTVAQAVARMARHEHLVWHLLPGNHDANRAGGLWERLVRQGLPAHLRLLLTAQPVEIHDDIWLLPAPLTGRATGSDPTFGMVAAATPPGATRIGLAHGSIRGFGSEQAAAVEISPDRAASAGLDYLALGDWHGTQEVASKTWYSGTPEPDRFMTNEPGYALAARVEAGAEPSVERMTTAQFTWLKRTQNVSHDPVIALHRPPQAAVNPALHNTLLQLSLTGRVTAERRQAIIKELRQLEASLRYLDADLSGLRLDAGQGSLDDLAGTGELQHVARHLLDRAADPSAADAAIAAEALALLLDFADEARGGAT